MAVCVPAWVGGFDAPASPICFFVIPGRPVPWARARVYVKGSADDPSLGFATAQAQRSFKRVVGSYARAALLQRAIRRPLHGPVWLTVRVFLPVPKTWQRSEPAKWADAISGGICLERPDMDNWVKLPMDAMEGLAFVDDAQVQGFPRSGKWFDNQSPRLEVGIWTRDPEAVAA